MTKRPSSAVLSGLRYRILWHPKLHAPPLSGAFGKCDRNNQVIHLYSRMTHARMLGVVVHELTHHYTYQYGLIDGPVTDEQMAVMNENAVVDFVRANPDFISWMASSIKP